VTEVPVTRDAENKRVYVLGDVGRVVLVPKKWFGAVRIEADGAAPWTIALPAWGAMKQFDAIDEAGTGAARFTQGKARSVGRGGDIVCGGRELRLVPDASRSVNSGPWILRENDREIARFPRSEWGMWKVSVTLTDEDACHRDPRLTLFAAWVAQRISASGAGVR
jgi:hypothetical protein